NTIVCAGGFTRSLLKAAGVSVPAYFTHTEVIEMREAGVRLNSLIMPADLQRFVLEAAATEEDALWEEPGIEPAPDILDAGAVQFLDGTIRVGQISHALTDPHAEVDINTSEARMRQAIAQVAPKLADLPGHAHHCLVAFSRDRLPLVGQIPGMKGIQVFSGFSNPLVFVPAYARHFAIYATTGTDEVIAQVSLERFV
ncbi:MAG: FAD-binding oxidoreductase, partial [Coleofasciculaceae cyanobacterium SM2_3_26]|nr:FAD-binding oxidoreductase [Coleofasciculaceae cyanobacterium SM2_3_26]